MNKRYVYIIALALLIASYSLRAQQWSGSTSTSGDIDRSGNVGIGDSSPSSALSIRGFTPPNGDEIWGDESTLTFHNGSLGDNGSYGLWLKWNVYREKVNADQRFLKFSNRPNAAEMYLSETGVRFNTAVASTEAAGATITMTNRMIIKPAGDVGIGTSNPSSKFHVATSTAGTEGMIVQKLSGGWMRFCPQFVNNNYNPIVEADDSGIIFSKGTQDSGGFVIAPWASGYGGIRMDSSGKVGIGISNPSNELEVNGTIRAKEIIVESTGWSDFVFEDDYDLPTLDEVSFFIDEHGHLPDIPSAEEVAANGITLGNMNAKLLQKIEELTLYSIEQEKRIQKLESLLTQFIHE